MSEKDDIKRAIAQLLNGNRRQAAVELLDLYNKVNKKYLRLKIIDGLLGSLDPVKDREKLLDISDVGMKLSKKLHQADTQAYFMSRRADLIMTSKVPFLQYELENLKLAPGWIEFSTEADKDRYKILASKINALENETDSLFEAALSLVGTNKKVEGQILMSKGSVEGARYLHFKTEYMSGNSRAKWWIRFHFLRYPVAEYIFIFNRLQSKKLRLCIDAFTDDYLKAAKIYDQLGDSSAGYAYNNLANHLKIAYKFRVAKKYLAKAKFVAEKYRDPLLMQQVVAMEKSIKAKNKDTPDYLAGESRQGVGL